MWIKFLTLVHFPSVTFVGDGPYIPQIVSCQQTFSCSIDLVPVEDVTSFFSIGVLLLSLSLSL